MPLSPNPEKTLYTQELSALGATERIFHLSHTDLDGYASQYVISQAFYNCQYYNCDYHQIDRTLQLMIKQIKEEIKAGKVVRLLLITDLSIDNGQAEWLQAQCALLTPTPSLLLLDHHATGTEVAEHFLWYQCDVRCCATRLSWRWTRQMLVEREAIDRLDRLSDFVNVTDLWIKADPRFNRANYLAGLMFERSCFPPDMTETAREYRFHTIAEVFNLFDQGQSISEVERARYDTRLRFLEHQGLDAHILNNHDLSMDSRFYRLCLRILLRGKLDIVRISGRRCCVMYAWNNTLFQHLSSMLFEQSSEVDICIRVAPNGRISLRSRSPQHDVGRLAQKFYNGGGHPCAAGGDLQSDVIQSQAIATKRLRELARKGEKKIGGKLP